MDNDLIVFEFDFFEREALLAPQIVAQIADNLRASLESVARAVVPQGMNASVEIYLAGAERGSIKLAFKTLWNAIGNEQVERRISSIGGTVTIGTLAGGLLIAAGHSLGLLIPEAPPSKKDQEVMLEMAKLTADSPSQVENIARLVDASIKSGADRIVIRVPEYPSCIISQSNSKDYELLGKLAPKNISIPSQSEFSTHVHLNDDKFDAQITERMTPRSRTETLYGGTIDIGKDRYPVLVIWRSKRPVPIGKRDRSEVQGIFLPFDQISITPLDPITVSGRRAIGVMIVRSQTVYE